MFLQYFYVTGKHFPDDTMGYVLKILVDEYKAKHGSVMLQSELDIP